MDYSALVNCEELAADAIAFASASGMNVFRDTMNKTQSSLVNVACTPTPFPMAQYEVAQKTTPEFLTLYDNLACNNKQLESFVAPAAAFDEITERLQEIANQVYTESRPYANEIRMNIVRNDFMLDRYSKQLVQIELNVMAASFAGLAQDIVRLQRHLMTKYQLGNPSLLPLVNNMEEFASVFLAAHNAYTARYPSTRRKAILFVILPDENNELDQRKIERAIFDFSGLISLRRSFEQLQTATLVEDRLVVDDFEISVCYFRAGYWPSHFQPDLWKVRLMLEQAVCPKCPSAPSQLSGMKIVQEALIPHPSARHLAHVFGQMGRPSELADVVFGDPSKWVLKSQIEGSGEVLFEEDMINRLQDSFGLDQFVLMKKVFPLPTPSLSITSTGTTVLRLAVGELGIYGGFVASGKEVLLNKVLGHLLRSKEQNTKQGGVFLGHAIVDAPYLISEEEYFNLSMLSVE